MIAAEERRKIAERTRAALAVLRVQGVQLAHPSTIDVARGRAMAEAGQNQTAIAREFGVHQMTISRVMRDNGIVKAKRA